MANQVVRWFPVVPAAAFAMTSAPCLAFAIEAAHLPDYPDVTVEHAELVVSPGGVSDSAYLTIYNGTGSEVSITNVTADGFLRAEIVKRGTHMFGYEEVVAEDADLIISRKSELDMGRDAIFITMERNGELPDKVTMTIGFDDGSHRTVPVRVVHTDREKTTHQHGAPELE